MKNKTHILISFFLFVFMSIAGAEEPTLNIDVENALQEGDANEVAVSNLKKVKLKVILDPKGQFELPSLAGIQVNPEDTEELTHWLEISAKVKSSEASVPLKAEVLRKTMPNGQVLLSVQILESEVVVNEKIQAYIDKLKGMAQAKYDEEPSESNLFVLEQYDQKKNALMPALKRYYMENRIGKYDIEINYHKADPQSWQGQIGQVVKNIEVKKLGECLCEVFENNG